MVHDIFLLAEIQDSLVEPLTPVSLAMVHPGWAVDVAAHGPWYQTIRPTGDLAWQSGTGASTAPVLVCGPCGSCLDVAWMLLHEKILPDFAAVLAVSQWAGRGQFRRAWYSPPGNLYAAWVWPWQSKLAFQEFPDLLSLAAGLAVAAGLEELGVPVMLKWPNDLLVRDHKVGGLVVEERGAAVLVGLGINLVEVPPPSMLREEHAIPAGDLAWIQLGRDQSAGAVLGPLGWWLHLSAAACRYYENILQGATVSYIIRLVEARLAWLGRPVQVQGGGLGFDKTVGIILGIASDGALRLQAVGREHRFTSGSIVPLITPYF
ncbi:BirA family transcriptional regulator, biotin operon repressor / biotin---(acetyl-CoA-carboxylase) ligase [Desulfovibrionales bacterium]